MSSKKEEVFNYIKKNSKKGDSENIAFTTQELSIALDMQRSNLSSILNALVKEQKIQKLMGRPVLYRYNMDNETSKLEDSCFKSLIGHDKSLKHAVQLAKAAILYPEHSLHTLICGPTGIEKKQFAKLMYEFAKENQVLDDNAPFIEFNCKYYENYECEVKEQLFGDNGIINNTQGGMIYIDHIEMMPIEACELLYHLLDEDNMNCTIIGFIHKKARKSLVDMLKTKFPVLIDFPSLQERTKEERFLLTQYSFFEEAMRMKREININSELLRCILLYRCDGNIKQFKKDIKLGCANAYVREFDSSESELNVYISDFPSYVRKGFLYYKDNRNVIESLIPQNYSYKFSEKNMKTIKNTGILTESTEEDTIYAVIDRKVKELRKRGIKEEDISVIINADLDHDFIKVTKKLVNDKINKESILKIVDNRIVTLVEQFLRDASKQFGKIYSESIFFGLCLHLSASLERDNKTQRLSNTKIMDIVEKFHEEYSFCLGFSSKVEKEFDVNLPIDEVVFITMFLCDSSIEEKQEKRPVVLVAMHGISTASSIAETVNMLVKAENTFAYDLHLDKDMGEAYEELKNKIQELDLGKGILFLYDMGSLKTMADMIEHDTGIKIKTIQLPATLLALDSSRKASTMVSLDEVYNDVTRSYKEMQLSYERKKNKKAILTLCMSGQGGAIQIKHYLEKNCPMEDVDIFSLAISDREYLLNEVNQIQKTHQVMYVIGTYDPKLYGITFISISKLFETPVDKLGMLLTLDNIELPELINYDVIYEYLDEQLDGLDIKQLKKVLPNTITKIKRKANGLSQDQEIGLFIHMACTIHRYIKKEKMLANIHKESIILKNKRLYNNIKNLLEDIESEFDILFSDDEIANIIGIIKKV